MGVEEEEEPEGPQLFLEADEGGTTEPEPGVYTYEEGQRVFLQASPEEGWDFEEWTGHKQTNETEITVKMTGNKTLTAHFTVEEPPSPISELTFWGVTKHFLEHLHEAEFEEAKKHTTGEAQKDVEEMGDSEKEEFEEASLVNMNMIDKEDNEEEIILEARITRAIEGQGETITQTFRLIEVEGKWKIMEIGATMNDP